MISVRLSKDMEDEIEKIAEYKHVTKTEIIKEAVASYIVEEKSSTRPYEAGKDLFGKYSSGHEDLSETYKERLKGKLNEKHSN